MAVNDYIRQRFFPHLWCAGCGHGIVLNGLIRAVEKLGMSRNEIVMVSGIGCSSRISGYMDFHTLHTIHGRALAFATGVKLSKPELNVIVPMGDGDALSIGGNHFIHAARRNIDITAIVMNNRIYGMTGGQYSADRSGDDGHHGAVFEYRPGVRRGGDGQGGRGDVRGAHDDLPRAADGGHHPAAILHDGFSVVEVMSQCPTYFGRKNKQGSAVDMMKRMKEITVPIGSKKKAENPELIERGIFVSGGQARVLQRVQQDHRTGHGRTIDGTMQNGVFRIGRPGGDHGGDHPGRGGGAARESDGGADPGLRCGGARRRHTVGRDHLGQPINFPKVIQPNVLVCLTQESYNKFYDIIRPGGLLIMDSRYVQPQLKVDARQRELPMYETVMDKIGKPIVFNICMLGAVVGSDRPGAAGVDHEGAGERIPSGFLDMNRQALELGLELGRVAGSHQGNRTAFLGLGADMADDEAVRAAREAPVGEQGDVLAQTGAHDGLVGVSISGMPGPPLGPS
jgi:2-oxoglutarate ferredoxin oxidoreductase subunit beta